MKTIILGIAIAAFSIHAQGQNQNVTNISKTTTTTVKDSDGEKQLVKKENTKEVQNIEFENADSNALNKSVQPSPVQVTSTVQITGPDGNTRTVDVDRSAYYSVGGDKYQVTVDNTGYTMMDQKGKRAGVLRQTGNNSYIYRTKDKTAVGWFDNNGNLILQTYDDKSDSFKTETYTKN